MALRCLLARHGEACVQFMSTFSLWSWPETSTAGATAPSDSQSSSHRSRSPPLQSASRPTEAAWQPPFHRGLPTAAGGAASRPCAAEPWTTGVAVCDAWLREHVTDMQVLNNFTELPEKNRKSIVLKAMEKPKDNPVAWIAACINNHRTREMERRLLSSASPHQTKTTSGIQSPASTAGRMSRSDPGTPVSASPGSGGCGRADSRHLGVRRS